MSESTAGPHARPVVVMLGLFTVSGFMVSAVMLDGDAYVWLDLITRGGSKTSPLATVTDLDAEQPRIAVEAAHRSWANRPEIRWHLARQTKQLYRAHPDDHTQPRDTRHNPPNGAGPRPSPGPSRYPEPLSRPSVALDDVAGEVVWRAGE